MQNVEPEQQTTNEDGEDEITILAEHPASRISNKDSQYSIMDSKPISLFNSDTQIKETPSLLDSSPKNIKKVILI